MAKKRNYPVKRGLQLLEIQIFKIVMNGGLCKKFIFLFYYNEIGLISYFVKILKHLFHIVNLFTLLKLKNDRIFTLRDG